jgi:hypothetical protein
MGGPVSVRSLLRECAADLLDTEPSVTVEHVVQCAYGRHGDVFAAEADRMVLQSARTLVAQMMRELVEDDDDQLSLAGIGLPSAICVQSPDGTYYVRSDKATWPELQAGRFTRVSNIHSAQRKLDMYDSRLDQLAPLMEHDPTLTVADAVRLMASAS